MEKTPMPRDPKEGELYDLKDGHGHCRHGIVLIERRGSGEAAKLWAVDTYWGGGYQVSAWYEIDDRLKARLTFIMDLTAARESHRDEWEIYADEDRAYIPMGGRRERFYVLKDARPNFVRRVERLESKIKQKRDEADSATRWADGYEKELQMLKDEHVHRPAAMGPCSPDCAICKEAITAS